jgi:NAD(P) transhydrogenase
MNYDLIVIGGGPAGEKGAAQAAYFGKRVALIEGSRNLAGVVANTGIPFKALRETALHLAGYRTRKLRGVDFRLDERATLRDFLAQAHALVRDLRFRAATNLDRHNVDVFAGQASFVDPHTVKVEHLGRPPTLLSGDVILIACGSRPYHPPGFRFDGHGIYDSDTFIQAHDMPRRLAVVGAGPMGCEYACVMALLGCSVSLINAGDMLIVEPAAAEPDRGRHRAHDGDPSGRGERGTAVHARARQSARGQGGRDRGGGGAHRQHRRSGAGERRARRRRTRPADGQ